MVDLTYLYMVKRIATMEFICYSIVAKHKPEEAARRAIARANLEMLCALYRFHKRRLGYVGQRGMAF